MTGVSRGTSLASAEQSSRMKVLLSPCHYIFDNETFGSEISWAYNVADGVASRFSDSVVVTGRSALIDRKSYSIVEAWPSLDRIQPGIMKAMIFSLRCSLAASKFSVRNKYQVVHHILPFGIDRTVNPYFLFFPKRSKKLIIGPIQGPLALADTDILSEDARLSAGASPYMTRVVWFRVVFRAILKHFSLKTLRRADVLIVVNSRARELILERGIDPAKIKIIPPGIDSSKFSFVPFNIKSFDHFELISVGLLLRRKGFDLVIMAISEILKTRNDVRLRIIGDGPQRETLTKLVDDLGITDYVIFQGYVPNGEIAEFYQAAHIFVTMSRSEIMAQMYLEAMACGLPIASSINETSSEVVKDNVSGVLVEQEDYSSLANRIVGLLSNPKMMSRYGLKARSIVETQYDWDSVIIPRYLEIYDCLTK